MSSNSFRFDHELAWPWSLQPLGPWGLFAVASVLVALTLWTYLGAKRATVQRVLLILGLRLLALMLAVLMVVRPSLAVRESTHLPAQLLILWDHSRSMTIRDEYAGQSRWDAIQEQVKKKRGEFADLEKQNVTIVQYAFAGDVQPFDDKTVPDGARTDVGTALQTLYNQHRTDKNLLALLIISDGADNGTRFPALTEAARWKTLPCKIYTIGVGKPTTSDRQRDVALTNITVEPSPVPVKGKLTVRVTVDAPGFENSPVNFILKLNGNEVLQQKETLRNTTANEIVLVTDAPEESGEVKVTVEAEHKPNEATYDNNEIHTFATITKEGISILLVDRLRPEQVPMRWALAADPRFRVFFSSRVNAERARGVDLFRFGEQHYDVIIIGDVSAGMFTAGDPGVLQHIRKLVETKGTGLLMMGGQDSFGPSWAGTPIADLLPVELDARGQLDNEVRIEPTDKGLEKIVMQLRDTPAASKQLWKELPPLAGMNKLGNVKPNATIFAARAGSGEPVIVYSQYKQGGRVVAFAGDETWRWLRYGQPRAKTGVEAHSRFWRQLMLFLAKQDEVDGSAWIKPEVRRIGAGGKLDFSVGLRGKRGIDLKDASFQVTVHTPQATDVPVETSRENDVERGSFWKTDRAGEYRISVAAKGKDLDGTAVSGTASVRFLVYQDEAELARRAADHDFLDKLARAGGGKLCPNLDKFFTEINRQTMAQSSVKTERWPDWDKESSLSGGPLEISWFLIFFFLLFAGVLCTEWFLRRRWGLV
jgi:uncharacterized membrane protein